MNIVIVIDGTNRQHLDILQRLTFNIVRLFGRETYVSFVVFGGTVDPTFAVWKTYVGLGPLQFACSSLRYATHRCLISDSHYKLLSLNAFSSKVLLE